MDIDINERVHALVAMRRVHILTVRRMIHIQEEKKRVTISTSFSRHRTVMNG